MLPAVNATDALTDPLMPLPTRSAHSTAHERRGTCVSAFLLVLNALHSAMPLGTSLGTHPCCQPGSELAASWACMHARTHAWAPGLALHHAPCTTRMV